MRGIRELEGGRGRRKGKEEEKREKCTVIEPKGVPQEECNAK